MNVTTILIQATALIAVLILLRPLLKRYLSARARCALWAIPAARLIFPFEIKSAFSLLKAAKPFPCTISPALLNTLSLILRKLRFTICLRNSSAGMLSRFLSAMKRCLRGLPYQRKYSLT